MFYHLAQSDRVSLFTRHEVSDMMQGSDGRWTLRVQNLDTHRSSSIRAKFVFIGAG